MYGPSATNSDRGVRLIGASWYVITNFLERSAKGGVDAEKPYRLNFVENPDAICKLRIGRAPEPGEIIISTGQIIRSAVICGVLAADLREAGENDYLNGIADGVYYDDFMSDQFRDRALDRRAPPNMEPAFEPVSDPDTFWQWAEKNLDSESPFKQEQLALTLLLHTLMFLVLHEASHLILEHHRVHQEIIEDNPESWDTDQKCLEVHADIGAAGSQMLGIFESSRDDIEVGPLLFLTTVGSIVALSMGGHVLRGLRTYDTPIDKSFETGRKYPHPAVRIALIDRVVYDRLKRTNLDQSTRTLIYNSAVVKARLKAVSALNRWFMREARAEGPGTQWGVPHPYNYLPAAFQMTSDVAREYHFVHFPIFIERRYPGTPNPLPPWDEA